MLKLTRTDSPSDATAEFTVPLHAAGSPVPPSTSGTSGLGLDDPTIMTPVPSTATRAMRESRMQEVKSAHPRRGFGRTVGGVFLGLVLILGLAAAGYSYGETRYQAGVDAGFSSGEQAGSEQAGDANYTQGYNDGVIEGYNDGYQQGYDRGVASAEQAGDDPADPSIPSGGGSQPAGQG